MSRYALRVVQAGAIGIVLAATALRAFDLDRFFVPKELVLHATALVAGVLLWRQMRIALATRIDRLLGLYLLLSAASALFATNHWLAFRALAVSGSGILLFFAARALRDIGLARPLLNALATAVVLAAVVALLQAYGVHLDVFATSRIPGGTLGNRNFVAHAAAFGFPVLLLALMHARHARTTALASAGIVLVTGSIVLTRSRAAWLAFAAMLVIVLVAILLAPALRRDVRTWRRVALVTLAMCGGVAAALLLPNALHWRSGNPYADTARSVTNYQEGSGHGRLVQYERSFFLALRHPLLGVGPGNWPVVYPQHVPANDPSLDTDERGMTANPWPSSDWVAFVTERGIAAAALLALAFVRIARDAVRRLRVAVDAEEALLAAALLGAVTAACITGAFDAVLLLALPSLIIWTTLGALTMPALAEPRPSPRAMRLAVPLLLVVALAGTLRSAAQLVAMDVYETRTDRALLEQASSLDPGSYRLHLRLARGGKRALRCEHARAAHALFPAAAAARETMRGCN